MQKTYYIYMLLGSTILNSTMLNLSVAQAACVATPDCESLGYTETSCPNNAIKCPWDTSKLLCACRKDYVFLCTGTGYSGGSGTSCDGKYASCNCAAKYAWDTDRCRPCIVGDIMFSDKTCGINLVSGKIPIGVVSDVSSGNSVYVVNLSRLSLMSWDSAVSTCSSYSIEGFGYWWLPSKDTLKTSVYTNNKAVNIGLSRAGGQGLESNYYWSGTEDSDPDYAYYVVSFRDEVSYRSKSSSLSVRCVNSF